MGRLHLFFRDENLYHGFTDASLRGDDTSLYIVRIMVIKCIV